MGRSWKRLGEASAPGQGWIFKPLQQAFLSLNILKTEKKLEKIKFRKEGARQSGKQIALNTIQTLKTEKNV